MPHETEILFNEPGIQYQGVNDASGGTGAYPIQGLIVGQFKRGRLDKPMTVHRDNIKAMLGYEPQNPCYTAVQDVLGTGVPNVQVLRIGGGGGNCVSINTNYRYWSIRLENELSYAQLEAFYRSCKISINGELRNDIEIDYGFGSFSVPWGMNGYFEITVCGNGLFYLERLAT